MVWFKQLWLPNFCYCCFTDVVVIIAIVVVVAVVIAVAAAVAIAITIAITMMMNLSRGTLILQIKNKEN